MRSNQLTDQMYDVCVFFIIFQVFCNCKKKEDLTTVRQDVHLWENNQPPCPGCLGWRVTTPPLRH